MAKYLIKKIEFCEACKGAGMVQHPAWVEYWKENAEKTLQMTAEQDRKWFEDHGWYSTSGDMKIDGTPDEEVFCGECEGKGHIESEVDLLEAVSLLHTALKTHGTY